MNSTELSIKRGKAKSAFSAMFSSPLYLAYAVATLALVIFMGVYIIGGVLTSPYTYADPNAVLPDEALPLVEGEEALMATITPEELNAYLPAGESIEVVSTDELWNTKPKFKEVLVKYKDEIQTLLETKGLKWTYTPEEVETYLPDINANIKRKAKSYTFDLLARTAADLQDTDSLFLAIILIIPFLIWSTLKAFGGLALYLSGRKHVEKDTPVSNFGISSLVAFNGGETITLIAVLALGGFYSILGGFDYANMVDKKTEEPIYGFVASYLPFLFFVIGIVVAVLAVISIKKAGERVKIALIEKDTALFISKRPAILCFIAAALPIVYAVLIKLICGDIVNDIVSGHTRLITLMNLIYDGNGFTLSFIIFAVLFAVKFFLTGLVYLNANKVEESLLH